MSGDNYGIQMGNGNKVNTIVNHVSVGNVTAETITIEQAKEAVSGLREIIEAMEFDGKQAALRYVGQIESEMEDEQPDKGVVVGKLERLGGLLEKSNVIIDQATALKEKATSIYHWCGAHSDLITAFLPAVQS